MPYRPNNVICGAPDWRLKRLAANQARSRRRRGFFVRGTPEAAARMSAAQKASWADGRTVEGFSPRDCQACDKTFKPTGGRQVYCGTRCRERSRGRLTASEYEDMYEAQGGVCALCGREGGGWSGSSGARRKRRGLLVIDHDHITGQVRALLCGNCNTALGRFGDCPVQLRAGAEYLERFL